MPVILLKPPLASNTPIKTLEVLWLDCTCAYDQLDETLMEDTEWDFLTKELLDREAEWSPYFKESVPRDCIASSTSSGINWKEGVPAIALEKLKKGLEKRRSWWLARL
jgi:hypothetical protein